MMPKCVDCASGICKGGGFSASSYQPRHRNTRNGTALALRPKATGNNTTLVARQEMYHRIALMSFLVSPLGLMLEGGAVVVTCWYL